MKKIITIIFTIYSFLLVNTSITYADEDCSLWGILVKDWFSIDAYSSYSSDDCDWAKITRSCNNWTLSWNSYYQYSSCSQTSTLWTSENLDIWSTNNDNNINLDLLNQLQSDEDIDVWDEWDKSVVELLFTIAKDVKTIFYILSGIYFLVLVVKILFSSNSEEEIWNFKKGILWITIWIILMQISYYFVNILYAQEIWWDLAGSFTSGIINPLIKVLETAASFFFILIAIFAFYSMVTANWDEEKVKTWKMSIFYWLIWFIVIKISKEIIAATYWKIDCSYNTVLGIFQINGSECVADNKLSWVSETIVNIINWMNSFVGIIVIIIIIYVGFQLLLWSTWDEDRLSKVKKSITYIVIWIAILVLNYFILTFFITPESII